MSTVVLYIICLFFFISGIDYVFGNKLKLGFKFEEGIKAMGALGLGMIGIYSLAPLMANGLAKIMFPICSFLDIDPSIFPASILAADMGGYELANKLAISSDLGKFSGVVIASTFGTAVSFTIPLAIGMIDKKDEKYFSEGVTAGIISIAFGSIIAGLWLGIDFKILLWNILPILIFLSLLIIGLSLKPEIVLRGFSIFGRIIIGLSIIGLLLQGLDTILGVRIISGMAPLSESMIIIGKITFILGGAFPMLAVLNRFFSKALEKIGDIFGINSAAVAGLIGNMASNILIFGTFKDMNPKGKVISAACSISGAFVFGGQLGYISGIEPKMVGAFILSKLIGGILSIFIAAWMYELGIKRNMKEKLELGLTN